MAIGVLPHMIPETEERYDLTLLKVGKGKRTLNAHFVIDNGQFTGKKVSGIIGDDLLAYLSEDLRKFASDASYKDMSELFAKINSHAKKFRYSALLTVVYEAAIDMEFVRVEPDYQESNVKVTYKLEDFADPEHESEITKTFKGSF
jgi:hypothetical protein